MTLSPLKRLKSRSSVTNWETPLSRQTATIWASKTRLPTAFASRIASFRRAGNSAPGQRTVTLGEAKILDSASHASSTVCGALNSRGVRDYPNELADAEHRNRPAGGCFGERHDTPVSRVMLWGVLAMRMNDDVGVYRDQLRPSILS